MNTYQLTIHVENHTPDICRRIEISDQYTVYQLHNILHLIFAWKLDQDFCFKIVDSKHSKTMNSTYELSYYLQEFSEFKYEVHSLNATYHCIIQAVLLLKSTSPLRLLDETNSIKSRKCDVSYLTQSSKNDIQLRLDSFVENEGYHNENSASIRTTFEHLLKQCRKSVHHISTDSPHLILVKHDQQVYPCYLERLEEDYELMIYFNESGFVRSILNSINEDPDLLFTDALTIDFLKDKVNTSDLYLYQERTLCFRNLPGCLPRHPNIHEILLMNSILESLLLALTTYEKQLPSLEHQKMLGMDEFQQFHVQEFYMVEQQYNIQLQEKEQCEFLMLPHNNEQITLRMVALPNPDSEANKQLDIHLVATGFNYTKDSLIKIQEMDTLVEQLYQFLKELIYERCIPESIQVNNVNLMHLLSSFCKVLHIQLHMQDTDVDMGNELLDMLTQTMHLSTDDLHTLDQMEGFQDKEEPTSMLPYVTSHIKHHDKMS